MTAAAHALKEGDILSGLWGYEQTNASFFKVVKRTAKQVVLVQLETIVKKWDAYLCGKAIPGDEKPGTERRFKIHNLGKDEFCFGQYCSLRLWDGTPEDVSSYY